MFLVGETSQQKGVLSFLSCTTGSEKMKCSLNRLADLKILYLKLEICALNRVKSYR